MVQQVNFVWQQGEDLLIELVYREGDTTETAVPVDLSTDYALRMDIVAQGATKERLYTFNTESMADVDPGPGVVIDDEVEGVLGTGADGAPNISIQVDRALTLPGGPIYAKMTATPAQLTFNYDIFLRKKSSDRQTKILRGAITIEESNTLWL